MTNASATQLARDYPTTPPPAPPERRAAVRYSPDPLVPVFFAHPLAAVPTAGLIADVSDTGVRIVAPPTARPMLHWGDPLRIIISYSESARDSAIEGMRLWAHVVRIQVDSREFRIQAEFDPQGSDGEWGRLSTWITALARAPRAR